jgi:hypothetical protein
VSAFWRVTELIDARAWLYAHDQRVDVGFELSDCYLVDPASSHMLVSKIKPCMSQYLL